MIISMLMRRLREGKTYADFRAAWKPDKGTATGSTANT